MKRLGQRILASSYFLDREYRLARLQVEAVRHRRSELVLVYQMGKVGSTAVSHALGEALRPRPVYHLHTLDRERLAREERIYRLGHRTSRRLDAHLLHSLLVRRMRSHRFLKPRRWKIVTLVRDPMARNISTFFQTLDLHFAHLGFVERIRARDPGVVADLRSAFLDTFPHRDVLSWFDVEIRRNFGIDVLAEGMNEASGCKLWSEGRADLLLLRTEDLRHLPVDAFEELLGLKRLAVPREKTSSGKYYAEVYPRFLDGFRAPTALLDDLYDSRMVRTLYSGSEIGRFRERWSGDRPQWSNQ